VSKKKGNYQIPFDKDGNQMDFPEKRWVNGEPIYPDMRDNFEFDDTLTLLDYGRGRSSVTFTLQRLNGKNVTMFVSDLCDMVKACESKQGVFHGRFTFCKKGQNYGCRLIKAES